MTLGDRTPGTKSTGTYHQADRWTTGRAEHPRTEQEMEWGVRGAAAECAARCPMAQAHPWWGRKIVGPERDDGWFEVM